MKDKVVFTFGRMNPPTAGHAHLINKMKSTAGSDADVIVYVSESVDSSKNPLTAQQKIEYLKMMFSGVEFRSAKLVFNVYNQLSNDGYSHAIMVIGDDRIPEFRSHERYNGKPATPADRFFKFKKMEFRSSGKRDPDSDSNDITSVSASRFRNEVRDHEANLKPRIKDIKRRAELFLETDGKICVSPQLSTEQFIAMYVDLVKAMRV